jgi:hypothetical protein
MTPPKCSVCDKRPHEVWRMLSGPRGVFACNECIDLMHERLHLQQPRLHGANVVPLGPKRKTVRDKKQQ